MKECKHERKKERKRPPASERASAEPGHSSCSLRWGFPRFLRGLPFALERTLKGRRSPSRATSLTATRASSRLASCPARIARGGPFTFPVQWQFPELKTHPKSPRAPSNAHPKAHPGLVEVLKRKLSVSDALAYWERRSVKQPLQRKLYHLFNSQARKSFSFKLGRGV